jgi:formate dehydrogenase subunit delta
MHIDYLVGMANDIGAFFANEPDPGIAAASVHNHLKRFWDPRMRAQIVAHFHAERGAGLEPTALNAIKLLAAEAAKQTGT